MLWRRRNSLSPPNVTPHWIQRRDWLSWEAPSNHVAGEASYQKALTGLVGPKCGGGYCLFTPVELVREPENSYDPNAFRAQVQGNLIGYLRKEYASQLAPALDRSRCRSFAVCGVVRGGSYSAPNLGVHLWLGRRVTPGPIITVTDDPWGVPWPPREHEM